MHAVDQLRLARLQILLRTVDRGLKRRWDPLDADAWRALSDQARGQALQSGAMEAIAEVLEGEPIGPALQVAYDALESDWVERFGDAGLPEMVTWEEDRHELDGPLLEALDAAEPSDADGDRLVHALLVALEEDTGGLTLSTTGATPRRLIQSSLRRSADRLRHSRIDAGWTVLAAFLDEPAAHEARLRRLITVLRAPPPALADPPPLDPDHPGARLLAPLVRWSQLPHFRGLRYDLPEVRRAFAAGPKDKGAAVLGMALLLAEPGPYRRACLEATFRPVCERWNLAGSRFKLDALQLQAVPDRDRLPGWLGDAMDRIVQRSLATPR